jgi:hypothetical protein
MGVFLGGSVLAGVGAFLIVKARQPARFVDVYETLFIDPYLADLLEMAI